MTDDLAYQSGLPFPVRLIDTATVDDIIYYSWIEQEFDPYTGVYSDMEDGRSGDTTDGPLLTEINNQNVSTDTIVKANVRGLVDSDLFYEFSASAETSVMALSGVSFEGVNVNTDSNGWLSFGIANKVEDTDNYAVGSAGIRLRYQEIGAAYVVRASFPITDDFSDLTVGDNVRAYLLNQAEDLSGSIVLLDAWSGTYDGNPMFAKLSCIWRPTFAETRDNIFVMLKKNGSAWADQTLELEDEPFDLVQLSCQFQMYKLFSIIEPL